MRYEVFDMKYLKLTVSGIMQYYADNSNVLKQEYRTSSVPIKSTIIGMVGAALGIPRGSIRLKELYEALDVKYKIIKQGVVDTDFRTINRLNFQNYYMNKQNTRNYFAKMDGTREKDTTKGYIKRVQYIQDAEFIAFLGGSDDLLKEIFEAFKNPVFALYFGKKCCVPNKPIVDDDFVLLDEGDLENVYDCI